MENIEYLEGQVVACGVCGGQGAWIDARSGDGCDGCNSTGKVPMFPMLRVKCHNCDGRGFNCDGRGINLAFIVGRYDCHTCKTTGYEAVYTDAPMNALLRRIRELFPTIELYPTGAWCIWWKQGEYVSSDLEGTDYERLIAALYEAMKSMGVKE